MEEEEEEEEEEMGEENAKLLLKEGCAFSLFSLSLSQCLASL